jgi:hypothetical protein
MNFSGQIEDFPIMDLMQYLHASKTNGVLSLRNGPQEGWVHFLDGQIVRARRPGMTNLGDRLLEHGKIKPNDLRTAVRIQKAQLKPEPLGMILEEIGAIGRQTLREAVIGQIEAVIYELASWEEGAFNFKLETCEPPDNISVALDDLIPPEEIDTKFLLLEAMRAFEAGKDSGSAAAGEIGTPENQTPSVEAGPINDQGVDGPAPAGDRGPANFSASIDLLLKMLYAGRKKDKTQSISVYFLRLLSEHLDRAMLFLVRRSELLGLGAFGQTVDSRSLDRQTRNWRLPLEPNSLLTQCLESRSPFRGEPEAQPWLTAIHERIGAPLTSEVMLLPVAGVERVICLVYGDNGIFPRPLAQPELLEIAAGQAGIIFENASLRKYALRKMP